MGKMKQPVTQLCTIMNPAPPTKQSSSRPSLTCHPVIHLCTIMSPTPATAIIKSSLTHMFSGDAIYGGAGDEHILQLQVSVHHVPAVEETHALHCRAHDPPATCSSSRSSSSSSSSTSSRSSLLGDPWRPRCSLDLSHWHW